MAEAVAKETGVAVPYQIGTMIELPRAALRAGEIAESAEFFSFGTNDLTQTTLGISRDDAASFLGTYTTRGILAADPFVTHRSGRRRRIGEDRRRTRPGDASRHEAWHLRRARRRSRLHRFLREGRARLCVLLALPRADRAARRGASRNRTAGGLDRLNGAHSSRRNGAGFWPKMRQEPMRPSRTVNSSAASAAPSAAGQEKTKSSCMIRVTIT